IMLGKYGEALIIDWGLARPVERDERARASGEKTLRPGSDDTESDVKDGVVGTPSYMSPEQASGGDVGPASDIYSLGATFYKLLTNETPVQGSSLREILNRVQSGNFRDPRDVLSTIPSVLEAICLRAMALNVDDRYESAMDLAEDLENYLADEPVSAYREPVTTRCIRWCRRNRTLAQGIAATLLIVVVAVSSVITSSWHHRKQSVRRELEQLRTIAAAQDAMLGSEIEGLRGDVLFLASQNSVKSLLAEIENPNNLTPAEKLRFEENSRPLIRQLQEFLKHKPSYMQARLINEHGWEVVRVERDASKLSDASVVNPAQIEVSVATKLRDKSGSGYFTQRTKHDPGYVYLSQLELNEEDGVKDWHFPVIRAAVPIADDQGKRLGIVIINMHFSTLANLVQKPLETEQNMLIYLTNAEGQFLIHPVEAISFCHVRGLDFDVQTTYQLGSFFRRSSETERELPDVHPRISILLELNKDSDKELGDVTDEVEQRFPSIQSKFSRKGEDREFAVLKGVEDAEQANDIISFVQRDFRSVVKTTILPAKYHDDRQLLYSRKINFGDEKSQRSIYLVLVKPY
ncbi:MAG: hypothetical protein IH991_17260, partial [Planctomycetes bacterium]|nr:hypothetical protein [Planctomycetota bacterium]